MVLMYVRFTWGYDGRRTNADVNGGDEVEQRMAVARIAP